MRQQLENFVCKPADHLAMVILQLLVTLIVLAQSNSVERFEILTDKLKNYSREILPSIQKHEPVDVKIGIFIHSIDSISEASMDFSITIYLRQWWYDPRLEFSEYNITEHLQLDVHTMALLWVPDLYFVNEKRGNYHDITVPNKLLHIFSNGTLFYSTRLSLTLSCNMDLSKYPLDSQVCPIRMESYSYNTEALKFSWNENPVNKSFDLVLPHFHLTRVSSRDCTEDYGVTGSFSCLEAEIYLVRKLGYYLCQVYAPSMLIVILSWVSFWLNVDTIPARISLGVLTVLMITTQTSGFSNSLPKVSYIKAIDIWMALCLVFVFAALIEFSLVNIFTRGGRVKVNVDAWSRTVKLLRQTKLKSNDDAAIQEEGRADEKPSDVKCKQKQKAKGKITDYERAERLDKISRVAFPGCFILFNIIYWTALRFS